MISQNLEKSKAREWVEQAWKKHGALIYKLCEIKCGNTEDAKDLFQTVALKFCRNAQRLMSKDDAQAWLVIVLHHTFLDSVREKERVSAMSCVAENSLRYGCFREEDSFFFVPPDGVEVVDMLEKASTVLNPVEKMIVDMSYFGGIPLDMQSNILGLSRNAVRKRRYVALKKMRNVLIPDSNEAVNDATVA